MSRASRCLRSRSDFDFDVGLPKCLATLLILLGVLAQMTGEAVSSAAAGAAEAATASGQHYQVQRVLSMHNNFSSTLPFIPSSTSILTAQHQQVTSGTLSPSAASMAASTSSKSSPGSILKTQPQPSSLIHRKNLRTPSSSVNSTSASTSSMTSTLVSVPIRHWWMAVYHHHGDQHSSLGTRVKRLLESSEAVEKFQECLHEDLGGGSHGQDVLQVHGEVEWEDRVCATTTLDDRVRVLLEALPCPKHQVCQILSPEVIQRLARPDLCRQVARDLWKSLFRKLYFMIRDFSDVLQQKLAIGNYSTMHEQIEDQHQRCKEAYNFWICSTHLPMWLLNRDNNKSVKVEACDSTCLTVEKQCPFLIKGTEDDMASGNPSFMCKDANVPKAVESSFCCYSQINEPPPGQGFPTNVSQGFCHEPDHVQLHLKTSRTTVEGGWSTSNSEDLENPLPHLKSSSNFHSSSCDKLLGPLEASFNVTASRRSNLTFGDLRTKSTEAAHEVLEDNEKKDNLIVSLARWLGFQEEEEAAFNGAKVINVDFCWTMILLVLPHWLTLGAFERR